MSGSSKIIEELFAEKSLLQVYRHSWSYSENNFDKYIRLVAAVILVAASLITSLSDADLFPAASKSIASWLNLGFSYATAILGFLVAGFTIFSTMTRTEVFIALAQKTHDTLGVSQLKFIFFSFLRVFILHIALLFVCAVVTMLKDSASIYLSLLHSERMTVLIKKTAVLVLLPVVGYLFVSTLLHLKTFVWNLYQSIIVAVAGAAVLYELDHSSDDKPGTAEPNS
jgi:hypothetical protein